MGLVSWGVLFYSPPVGGCPFCRPGGHPHPPCPCMLPIILSYRDRISVNRIDLLFLYQRTYSIFGFSTESQAFKHQFTELLIQKLSLFFSSSVNSFASRQHWWVRFESRVSSSDTHNSSFRIKSFQSLSSSLIILFIVQLEYHAVQIPFTLLWFVRFLMFIDFYRNAQIILLYWRILLFFFVILCGFGFLSTIFCICNTRKW